MNKTTVLFFLFFTFPLWIFFIPFPIPPYLDFQVLYHANLGLLQGIALYDHAAQTELIAHLAGVHPDQVIVLPFPYPPWYALSTLFLALLPIQSAARLWFGLNLSMLLISVWLITDGWRPAPRLASFLAAILFAPVVGSLYVGQFIFPVLLGASLMNYALRHGNAKLTALAAALLTFKPHLGGPLSGATILYLLLNRGEFARRALKAVLVVAVLLFGLGFLADPLWPIAYLRSLFDFRHLPGVSSCALCASLPVGLTALLIGRTDVSLALPIGAVLLIILFAGLFFLRRPIFRRPESFISTVILITLSADPYLLNYDFALLLVPLFLTTASIRPVDWFWPAIAWLLPLILLGLFGRSGSPFLPLTALMLLSRQVVCTPSTDPPTTNMR